MGLLKASLVALFACSLLSSTSLATNNRKLVQEGKKIFLSKRLGNCVACHDLAGLDVPQAGAVGPKLEHLSKLPYSFLYNQIWDAHKNNPASIMPPFGRNGILTKYQIKAVVAFLKTIK